MFQSTTQSFAVNAGYFSECLADPERQIRHNVHLLRVLRTTVAASRRGGLERYAVSVYVFSSANVVKK